MKNIQEADVNNKSVLIRIDTDVKLVSAQGGEAKIVNDRRLRASLPTLKYLLENKAHVTIIGHIGRPEGKVDPKLKMKPVEDKLVEFLGSHENWQILENLRFSPGEENNDPEYVKHLALNQNLFVNDAFATMHRAHASTFGIAEILPSFAGLSVQKEVKNLEQILKTKEKPFTVILGGAKISDKLPVLKNLISRAQNFLIGGAISNTFLASRRHFLGDSLVEENSFREANLIWQNIIDERDRNIYLPIDLVTSLRVDEPREMKVIKTSQTLAPSYLGQDKVVDIGSQTIEVFKKNIEKSKVIFWNGNMGVSEVPEFARGTLEIAKAIINSKAQQIVIGGGDTVAAIEKLITNDSIPRNLFLSNGGGATLEFIAGKQLPGLKALEYYQNI